MYDLVYPIKGKMVCIFMKLLFRDAVQISDKLQNI